MKSGYKEQPEGLELCSLCVWGGGGAVGESSSDLSGSHRTELGPVGEKSWEAGFHPSLGQTFPIFEHLSFMM